MVSTDKSKSLNILSVFASVILSILFVFMAILVPVYYSVADLIKPKTITKIMQNIDYVEVLQVSDEVNQSIKDIGIDTRIADEIMKSKEMGALLEDFTKELTIVLADSNSDLNDVDAIFVQEIIDKHFDDTIRIIKEKNNLPIENDKIKQEITQIILSKDEEIKQTAKTLEPMKEAISAFDTTAKIVQKSSRWQYVLGMCIIEVLFLCLIYFMRKKNYGGFIWIAVNTGIAGVIVLGTVLALGGGFAKYLTAELSVFLNGMVNSAADTILAKLIIALVVCFIVMAISIVVCIVLRMRKQAEETGEEAALEPATIAVEKTV